MIERKRAWSYLDGIRDILYRLFKVARQNAAIYGSLAHIHPAYKSANMLISIHMHVFAGKVST